MAHALVHHALAVDNSGSSTALTLTFTAATATNGLFGIFAYGVGNTLSGVTAGWTKVGSTHDNGGDALLELWTKTAAGGETVFAATESAASGWYVWVGEWSGISTTVDQSAESNDALSFSVAHGTGLSSGTTGTTTTANELLIAGFCANNTALSTPTFSNGFTALDGGGASSRLYVGYNDVTATGTYSTTFTWAAGDGVDLTGAIWTFADTPAGAAPTPRPRNTAVQRAAYR